MKSLLGLTLALVAIGATGAHAQACPERVTSQVERALGPETAWLADDISVHRPINMRLVGQSVSYVLVERVRHYEADPRTWPIKTLSFRLSGVGRRSGEHFPERVMRDFDRAYPDAGCASSESLMCDAYPDLPYEIGYLNSVELIDPTIYVPDNARGERLGQLRADADAQDPAPGFLVCTYRAD